MSASDGRGGRAPRSTSTRSQNILGSSRNQQQPSLVLGARQGITHRRPGIHNLSQESNSGGGPTEQQQTQHQDHSESSNTSQVGTVTQTRSGLATGPSSSLTAHKRRHRLRRKDPSCDVCRDRKVKCDATGTTSCSECLSRGLLCQFTKEMSRRMSSSKQLQELEHQLASARKRNARLESLLRPADSMDVDLATLSPQLQPSDISPSKRPLSSYDFTQERRNIVQLSRNIFRPPPLYRMVSALPRSLHGAVLPSRHVAMHLVTQAQQLLHLQNPLVDWPAYFRTFDAVYAAGTLGVASRVWSALFYTVLAIGTLQLDVPSFALGSYSQDYGYIQNALQHIDIFFDETSIDHCRTALLMSFYYLEKNSQSTARVWLTLAWSSAVSSGLCCHSIVADANQNQVYRNLWWSLRTWDRILSLELSERHVISSEMKTGVQPRTTPSIDETTPLTPSAEQQAGSDLWLMNVHLSRLLDPLMNILEDAHPSDLAMQQLESNFEAVSSLHPDELLSISSSTLRPSSLRFSCILSNAKILLRRRGIDPCYTVERRATAISGCVAAARESARMISRSNPDSRETEQIRNSTDQVWQAEIRSTATSMFCKHLWRCLLFLCHSLDFESALICAKVCRTIGDLRKINIACGTQLHFFIQRLRERMQTSRYIHANMFDNDEEILAYVSGDLQADARSSWVWAQAPPREPEQQFPDEAVASEQQSPGDSGTDRDVWHKVEALLVSLAQDQQQHAADVSRAGQQMPATSEPPPSRASAEAIARGATASPSASSAQRMSIAHIM